MVVNVTDADDVPVEAVGTEHALLLGDDIVCESISHRESEPVQIVDNRLQAPDCTKR